MNLLRETPEHHLDQGYEVVLDVSHLKKTKIDLLYSFIEIWMLGHCKSEWDMSQLETDPDEHHRVYTEIRLVFKDVREALYFKLGPLALHHKPRSKLTVT